MKQFLAFIIASMVLSTGIAQTIGSKVKMTDAAEKTYDGIIMEIKDGKYKVKYEGYDFDAWLLPEQFKLSTPNAAVNNQQPAGTFKTGDRVECDKAGIDSWEKGTIMPFLKNDFTDGKTYRVRLDAQARGGMYLEGIVVMIAKIRLLPNAPAYQAEKTAIPIGKAKVDKDNTLSADRPILDCPIQQKNAVNGDRPDPELCKKIIRCKKGEKVASKGYDGAMTVDVTALQIGISHKEPGYDKNGINVYPVKATFTYKTFYRTRTEVSENWIRILNFYVDAFGEWAIGSEENVKSGITKHIPVE